MELQTSYCVCAEVQKEKEISIENSFRFTESLYEKYAELKVFDPECVNKKEFILASCDAEILRDMFFDYNVSVN